MSLDSLFQGNDERKKFPGGTPGMTGVIMNKILLFDKPTGWTSFDVVAKIRGAVKREFETRNSKLEIKSSRKIRVGHAGTLDPFATGLLIVLIGDATKQQDQFMKLDKEYEATLKLGFTSTTGDPEGEIKAISDMQYAIRDEDGALAVDCHVANPRFAPRNGELKEVLNQFTGEISQIPSIYSAIKIDGKRAYKLAREGKSPIMKARQVTIYELSLMSFNFPMLKIKVKCSSGTYIRTLAEDIGKALGCGAYLTELRRTKIGEYGIEDAKTIEQM